MSSNLSDSSLAPAFNSTDFQLKNQTLLLYTPDGTPVPFTTSEVDGFYSYALGSGVNYAAQLGASLIILIMLAVLTKPDKRSSPIFAINCLSLAINVIRLVLMCVYLDGPFNDFYAYITGDFSAVPSSAYQVSAVSAVFSFLLVVLIEMSLAFQVHVVCITMPRLHRRILLVLSVAVGVIAIGFRFILCIRNVQAIYSLSPSEDFLWAQMASLNAVTASIFWFCAAFVTKLGFCLHNRTKMNMPSFGPMKVIFIMGFQTMIIPALFAILQYCNLGLPNSSSDTLTAVAISLPLSSIWAAATVTGDTCGSDRLMARKPFSDASTTRNNSSAMYFRSREHANASPIAKAFTNTTTVESARHAKTYSGRGYDLEHNGEGVIVEKSFGVSEK